MNSNQREQSGSTTSRLIDERQEKELRLVLIGESGYGKSSFGNTLCNRQAFSTSRGCSAHTKRCCPATRQLDNIEIVVYDTPGLFDTSVDYSIIKKQLCDAITSIASPGPHAFLIVLSAVRVTEEEQKTVQLINDMFGKDAGKYCILIITREDDILNEKLTLEKYIEISTPSFKNLLAQCQNRVLAVNNRAGEDERESKVRQLITIVQNMLRDNQSPYYTNDMFQQAEKDLRQREEAALNQAKEQMEEQKKALSDELRREFEEEAEKKLTQLTKELRLYQRDELAKKQSLDQKSCFDLVKKSELQLQTA